MIQEVYIKSAHTILEGTVRAWGDYPDPGDEINCRCWAVELSDEEEKKFREKFGPSDCRMQNKIYETAQIKFREIKNRKNQALNELQKLIEDQKKIVNKMQKALGMQIASIIIGLPLEGAGFIVEMLQRFFGNTISNEMLKIADQLAQQRTTLLRQIEYKRDQLIVVDSQLQNTIDELGKAKEALEECKKKSH